MVQGGERGPQVQFLRETGLKEMALSCQPCQDLTARPAHGPQLRPSLLPMKACGEDGKVDQLCASCPWPRPHMSDTRPGQQGQHRPRTGAKVPQDSRPTAATPTHSVWAPEPEDAWVTPVGQVLSTHFAYLRGGVSESEALATETPLGSRAWTGA